MKFLLDENFPKSADHLLCDLGHAVLDIRGTDDEGANDPEIFAMAQGAQAILSRLSWFLDHFRHQSLANKAYLLRDRTYAVYPADEPSRRTPRPIG